MQAYSINKNTIDWPAFRARVLDAAATARTVQELYPAISIALDLLSDSQSYYMGRDGAVLGPPPVGGCTAAASHRPELPESIGYVRIEPCDCDGIAADQYAESIQRVIRSADRPGLIGWVVDLRGNFGGNMWPMIAGVGPVLGEGIIGWIVYYDREYEREYRNGAALSLGETFARVASPYSLLEQYPKVAVLTDGQVSSSGEAITVYFKGRPRTRSFGTPTCGHHHLQQYFALTGRAGLYLVTSQHADRLKRKYSSAIVPDEVIEDPEETVRQAIAWLQGLD